MRRPKQLGRLASRLMVQANRDDVASLLKAMNRIYEIEETRPFWERNLVGLWLTTLAGGVLASAFLILSLGQILAQQTGGDSAPSWFQALAGFTRWPLLVLILLVEASVVFRVAPNRKPPWRLITPGALVFVIGWMFASTLFVLYVDKSGGYAGTYGVLGGVVVLLLWLQITAYALLLGAELNDLLEHPTRLAGSRDYRGGWRQRVHRGDARGCGARGAAGIPGGPGAIRAERGRSPANGCD